MFLSFMFQGPFSPFLFNHVLIRYNKAKVFHRDVLSHLHEFRENEFSLMKLIKTKSFLVILIP